jgi:hypothetical protein
MVGCFEKRFPPNTPGMVTSGHDETSQSHESLRLDPSRRQRRHWRTIRDRAGNPARGLAPNSGQGGHCGGSEGEEMTIKRWWLYEFMGGIVFMVAFGFCVVNRFEKTAWFIILPAGITFKFLMHRIKISN